MHPTLAGFYPFLLGSPARCAFLLYLCLYICLGSPARSRPSHSAVALTLTTTTTKQHGMMTTMAEDFISEYFDSVQLMSQKKMSWLRKK